MKYAWASYIIMKGYPFGLKDDEISSYGKIIAIADVYAMRSNRSYEAVVPSQDAFRFLINNVGTYFDSELMNIFKDMLMDSLFRLTKADRFFYLSIWK
jgi:HD-GYP domain-containing protein (c-di-GMP phosphodiesterase class II)